MYYTVYKITNLVNNKIYIGVHKNSQFGTMWIHSLTEKVSKKIKQDELSTYQRQGWLKGRKIKF